MINIRLAKKDEVQKLQDLNDEVFVDNYKYDSDLKIDWAQSTVGKDYFTGLLNNPESICLIAEEDNTPVGYIAAGPKDFDYRLSKCIEIENMGIVPNYRLKGISSRLIEKVLELAKGRGFQKVYVNTYIENERAINFYEKSGFKKIDVSLERNI